MISDFNICNKDKSILYSDTNDEGKFALKKFNMLNGINETLIDYNKDPQLPQLLSNEDKIILELGNDLYIFNITTNEYENIFSRKGHVSGFCNINQDNALVAFTSVSRENPPNIFVYNINTKETVKLVDNMYGNRFPYWSYSDKYIAYLKQKLSDINKNRYIGIYNVESGEEIILPRSSKGQCYINRHCWNNKKDEIIYVEITPNISKVKIYSLENKCFTTIIEEKDIVETSFIDDDNILLIYKDTSRLYSLSKNLKTNIELNDNENILVKFHGAIIRVIDNTLYFLTTERKLYRVTLLGELTLLLEISNMKISNKVDSNAKTSNTVASDVQASNKVTSNARVSDTVASDVKVSNKVVSDTVVPDVQASNTIASDVKVSDTVVSDLKVPNKVASNIKSFKDKISIESSDEMPLEPVLLNKVIHHFKMSDNVEISVYENKPEISNGLNCLLVIGGPNGKPKANIGVANMLLKKGYTVFSIAYRGCEGIPYKFGEMGKRDVLDIIEVGEALKNKFRFKLPVIGFSYGGLLTFLALSKSKNTFQCGISLWGVTKIAYLQLHYKNFISAEMNATDKEMAFNERDAVKSSKNIRTPMLIFHGANDITSIIDDVEAISQNIIMNKKNCQVIIYDNDGHGLSKNTDDFMDKLDNYLKSNVPIILEELNS